MPTGWVVAVAAVALGAGMFFWHSRCIIRPRWDAETAKKLVNPHQQSVLGHLAVAGRGDLTVGELGLKLGAKGSPLPRTAEEAARKLCLAGCAKALGRDRYAITTAGRRVEDILLEPRRLDVLRMLKGVVGQSNQLDRENMKLDGTLGWRNCDPDFRLAWGLYRRGLAELVEQRPLPRSEGGPAELLVFFRISETGRDYVREHSAPKVASVEQV